MTESSGEVSRDWSRTYYQRPLIRWLLTAAALLGVLHAVLNPTLIPLLGLPVWGVLTLIVWFVPVGVVTALSIKPAPFRARIPWAKIAGVSERRSHGSSSVQLVLKDGRAVSCRIPVSEIGDLRRLAESVAAPGYGPQPTWPKPVPVTRNRASTLAFTFGGIAVLFFPIVLGPVAIVCAAVATNRGESRARVAMAFAVTATIFGFILGAVMFRMRGA